MSAKGGKAMGRRGGTKTRDTHDADYYQRIGSKGGRTTAHRRELAAEAEHLFDAHGNRVPTDEIPFLPDEDDE